MKSGQALVPPKLIDEELWQEPGKSLLCPNRSSPHDQKASSSFWRLGRKERPLREIVGTSGRGSFTTIVHRLATVCSGEFNKQGCE